MRGPDHLLMTRACPVVLVVCVLLLGAVAATVQAEAATVAHAPMADIDGLPMGPFILEASFPDHEAVMTRLDALVDHPWMSVHTIGASHEGRDIRLVEVVDPDSTVPLEDRAVTLLLTQQHGNEPAGTPAVLDLLDEIAAGDPIAKTLENQILLVLPMANPDGSDDDSRTNTDGVDTNRDHNHLETHEARSMHGVLNDWPVHVALDHHEYGGTGLGNPVPLRLYDYDLTTLVPTHAGVHPMVLTMAKNLMYDGIWPPAEAAGYSANEYGEVTVAGEPVGHLAGGPDPGILRNHLGLHHTAGILIETRIDGHPNPFHDEERRIHIQYLTMVGTLEYVHEHAGLFVAMREESMAQHDRAAPEWYDEGAWQAVTDPSLELEEEESPRSRIPEAFRITGDANEIMQLFELHGLPPGAVTADGVVHNVDHGWPVHAAALLSEASSRQVLEGTPTEVVPVPSEAEASDDEAAIPGLPAFVLLLVVAGAGWRLACRRA